MDWRQSFRALAANAPSTTANLLQSFAALNEEEDAVQAGPSGSSMESLEYEVVESAVYRDSEAKKRWWDRNVYVALKWLLAFLIGVGTGFTIFFINVAVENFAGVKFAVSFAALRHSYFLSFLVYAFFNVALVFSSSAIVCYFAPASAGSGIPEIKGYLNGIDTPGILLFRTLVGKVFGSIGSVAGGLALGKEGPLVHTGACIASLLGQGGSTKYRLPWGPMKLFKNDRDRRDLVTIGAAAGVSAAFRSPVGGVLFALEEVASWWRPALMWRVFFSSAVVAITVRAAMGWCKNGGCGHSGTGGFIVYEFSGGQEDYSFSELVPMGLVGLIGGVLGALFNQLTKYLATWRRDVLHKKGPKVKVIEACLVALITSICSFGLPMLTQCTPCPDPERFPDVACPRKDPHFGNFVNFRCAEPTQYNDLATIFFNTQDDAIRNLFSARTVHEYSAHSLLVFLVTFYILAVLTYGIAVPSGQFVPGIMIGATYGRLVGMLVVHVSSNDQIDEGTYALLGAAAFLGGSMRMTVALCVIMVEITNNLHLLPLIMLVLLIAKTVGDSFNEGFYDLHARVKQIPILEPHLKAAMRQLTARDTAAAPVVQFSRVERVGHIVDTLRRCQHNGFPVLHRGQDGATVLLGSVMRNHLLVLLRSGADFQQTPQANDANSASLPRYDATDFAKAVSSHGLSISDVVLRPEELDMYLDLLPFVNRTPFVVAEDMSLGKAYSLFRNIGLRHLLVVPPPSRVTGILTRKDFLPGALDNDGYEGYSEPLAPVQTVMRRNPFRTLQAVANGDP